MLRILEHSGVMRKLHVRLIVVYHAFPTTATIPPYAIKSVIKIIQRWQIGALQIDVTHPSLIICFVENELEIFPGHDVGGVSMCLFVTIYRRNVYLSPLVEGFHCFWTKRCGFISAEYSQAEDQYWFFSKNLRNSAAVIQIPFQKRVYIKEMYNIWQLFMFLMIYGIWTFQL